MVGCRGFAPRSRRVRAGTSLSKVAARKPRGTARILSPGHLEMVRAAGNAPACSCSRSRRLTFRLRSGEMDGHQGIAPCTPVWKTGVYLSTPMPGGWSPVLESHQSLRLCRPPPDLIGQRDSKGDGTGGSPGRRPCCDGHLGVASLHRSLLTSEQNPRSLLAPWRQNRPRRACRGRSGRPA